MIVEVRDQGSDVGLNKRIDRLKKRGLICALWMFVLLNLIFRDLHEIVKAEFLEQALTGIYNGQEVTETMFLVGGIIVEIPILMMLLAWVLPVQVSRWANMVIASLFGFLVAFGSPGDLDDYFHAAWQLIALAIIVWQAWTWERSVTRGRRNNDRERAGHARSAPHHL